ncbi:hypothetical protein Bbelb_010020 [Branchiostoma belcheri]|nr:hypothetical protein Bbelb_010020 [Branchiostoma belcheri]
MNEYHPIGWIPISVEIGSANGKVQESTIRSQHYLPARVDTENPKLSARNEIELDAAPLPAPDRWVSGTVLSQDYSTAWQTRVPIGLVYGQKQGENLYLQTASAVSVKADPLMATPCSVLLTRHIRKPRPSSGVTRKTPCLIYRFTYMERVAHSAHQEAKTLLWSNKKNTMSYLSIYLHGGIVFACYSPGTSGSQEQEKHHALSIDLTPRRYCFCVLLTRHIRKPRPSSGVARKTPCLIYRFNATERVAHPAHQEAKTLLWSNKKNTMSLSINATEVLFLRVAHPAHQEAETLLWSNKKNTMSYLSINATESEKVYIW